MKYVLRVLFISMFVLMQISCDPINDPINQRAAKAGLNADLSELPTVEHFTMIKTIALEFPDSNLGFGPTCYLERGYVTLGSSLPEQEALDLYFQEVQQIGWIPRQQQYETSKVLSRGPNEKMELHIGDPGVDIKDEANFAKLSQDYQSLVFVSIDYVMPDPGKY